MLKLTFAISASVRVPLAPVLRVWRSPRWRHPLRPHVPVHCHRSPTEATLLLAAVWRVNRSDGHDPWGREWCHHSLRFITWVTRLMFTVNVKVCTWRTRAEYHRTSPFLSEDRAHLKSECNYCRFSIITWLSICQLWATFKITLSFGPKKK